MPDEQITAGFNGLRQTVYQLLLLAAVKVDHDIATKDHRECLAMRKRFHQIQAAELNQRANLFLH